MIKYFISGFLVTLIVLSFFLFSSNDVSEPFNCPDFTAGKDYVDENLQMSFNDENYYFALIDSKCNLVKDDSEYYFDEFFTYQYALIVSNTPKSKVDDLHSAVKFVKNIIEDTFPKTNNVELTTIKDKILFKLDKNLDFTNDINKMNTILNDYSNLYDSSTNGLNDDDLLSDVEILSFQNNFSLFVYDTLLYSDTLSDLQSAFTSNLGGGGGKFIMWLDWVFWWTDWYTNLKKSFYITAINNFFFDAPIGLLHKQMLNELETD